MEIDKLLIKLDGTTAGAVTDLAGNKLDGEWTNESSIYPSGDGSPEGDFIFQFHSLPGDVDNSNTVDSADETDVRSSFGTFTGFGSYSVFDDVDGNGFVVSNDVLFTRARDGDTLPASNPSPLAEPPPPVATTPENLGPANLRRLRRLLRAHRRATRVSLGAEPTALERLADRVSRVDLRGSDAWTRTLRRIMRLSRREGGDRMANLLADLLNEDDQDRTRRGTIETISIL